MVSSDKKLANVVGGKTARACDSCIRKRARWYCAADDAFLCQSCDGSVHSANPLARRHERVHLKVASLKLSSLDKHSPPPWHHGFTKKPRTPRGGNHHKQASKQTPKAEENSMSFNPLHLVPEIGYDESATLTSEEQLLYQVPVFDPFAAELCLSNEVAMPVKQMEVTTHLEVDHHHDHHHHHHFSKVTFDLNSLNGLILPSDVEMAEFAADVESLLGKGLDEESFAMDRLGLSDCREKDTSESFERVKVEKEEEDDQMQCEMVESELEMMREPFQLSFDYDSPLWDEKDEKVAVEFGDYIGVVKEDDDHGDDVDVEKYDDDENKKNKNNNKRILKLDYGGIIAAWDEQRSPWTTGDRPELDPDDCWPDCMGGCGIMHHQRVPYGDKGMMTGNLANLDGGREARVSRYREKRRTRLFSKKIRYEVRKLNAEKRPRMKGRFVKRASSSGFPLLSK